MPSATDEIDLISAERRLHSALVHPAFSQWLKDSIRSALGRDPLALANDLELLGHLLRPWTEAHIARAASGAPTATRHDARHDRSGAPCPSGGGA